MGGKFGRCLFYHWDVSFYGEYLGVMAKSGPFCRRDNCSKVRGVLDKFITHLLVQSIHVCRWLDCWGPGAGWGAGAGASAVLEGGVGAMGVAGAVDCPEARVEVLGMLDGTFWCPLKLFSGSMLSTFVVHLVRLSKYPFCLKNRCLNLLMCFPLILLCLCSLIF